MSEIKPKIEVRVIGESGYEQALFGMGLSFGLTSGMDFCEFVGESGQEKFAKMEKVTEANASNDGGHNKYLESIYLWLDVNAPRFWWSEMDTYRHSTKQSESTIHTLVKEMEALYPFVRKIFEGDKLQSLEEELALKKVEDYYVEHFDVASELPPDVWNINCELDDFTEKIYTLGLISDPMKKLLYVKKILPESYLQRRIMVVNYKTMRNIVLQRFNHKLPHWQKFIDDVLKQVEHPELFKKEIKLFGGLKVKGGKDE